MLWDMSSILEGNTENCKGKTAKIKMATMAEIRLLGTLIHSFSDFSQNR